MTPTMAENTGSQVALLHRISSIVSSDQDLESILRELVSLTMNVTHSDACLVYLIDHATNEIVLRASQLPHDAEIGKVRLKMGEGITGWVAVHNSVVALAKNASRMRVSSASVRCRKILTRRFFPCRWSIAAK